MSEFYYFDRHNPLFVDPPCGVLPIYLAAWQLLEELGNE